jgi:hypothetical protein
MGQWGLADNAANSVSWAAAALGKGSGKAAKAANNAALYGNSGVGAFVPNLAVGQFGVSPAETANGGGEGRNVHAAGWILRRVGLGGVKSLTANGGTGFVSGETVKLSGGTANGYATLTANSTGGLTGATIGAGGTFVNVAQATVAFNREKHLSAITVAGTPTGYSNTDTILISNGTINGTASISTNATGGFVSANVTIINAGLWPAAATNTDPVVTIRSASGGASLGTGATFTTSLVTSTGGTVTVTALGGRAGRITYECLVSQTSQSNGTTDNTFFPS